MHPTSAAPEESLPVLSAMLRLSLQFSFRPDREILEAVALHLCCLSSKTLPLSSDWGRLMTCIKLDPSLVTKTYPARDKNFLSQSSPVLQAVLETVGRCAAEAEYALGNSAQGVIIAIAEAFADARETHRFIDIWKEQLKREFSSGDLPLKRSIGFAATCIWSNEKLVRSIAPKLLSSLSHQHISDTLIQLDTLLLVLPAGEDKENTIFHLWAHLVVVHCLLSTPRDDKLGNALLKRVRTVYTRLPEAFEQELPPRLESRLWQLLAQMCEGWPELYAEEEINSIIDRMLSIARERLRVKDEGRPDQDACKFETWLSVGTFIAILAGLWAQKPTDDQNDASTALDSALALARDQQDRYRDSVSGLAGPSPVEPFVWDGTLGSIQSQEQFPPALLAILFARLSTIESVSQTTLCSSSDLLFKVN